MIIWVGVVHHKYGSNFYVGKTRSEVIDQIWGYCEYHWSDVVKAAGEDVQKPVNPHDLVEYYFDVVEWGSYEIGWAIVDAPDKEEQCS